MQLKDIAAIVTGGASGLGAATARALAAKGAKVAVCDLNTKLAESVAAEIKGVGITCDVADSASAEAAVAEAAKAHGPARVLINNVGNRKHWLGLRLADTRSVRLQADDRPAKAGHYVPGARVEVIRKNSPTIWRRSRVDGSYASANDPRVLVGLGDSTETPTVRVHWVDGRTTELTNVSIDRYITVTEPR